MLSLEYLLEEAKNNGLPGVKKRDILREYLQVIILNSIYKCSFGKSMLFTGGTSLRYFYSMPRFSEDLDFDSKGIPYEDFTKVIEYARKGLTEEGFTVSINSEKRNKLYVAEICFKDLMKLYDITDARGVDVMIKIEVYKPSWKLHSESMVISLYGYNFTVVLLDRRDMFSEKLCALFNRKRGRDIYDTLFMLKRKFQFNEDILKANKIKDFSKDMILNYLKNIPKKELIFLGNQIKPFLFRDDELELIVNAPLYAERFLKEYTS